MRFRQFILIAALFLPLSTLAKGVYLSPDQFLAGAFPTGGQQAQTLWLKKPAKQTLAVILNHEYNGMRVRYWSLNDRTAWVFNEIGKEMPITIGVVIEHDKVVQVDILAFRESRGGEVRYPFFTDQLRGMGLDSDQHLTEKVDGISGATLSVRAVTRATRMALYLHKMTTNSNFSATAQ